jgi:hypothetical protein
MQLDDAAFIDAGVLSVRDGLGGSSISGGCGKR